MLDVAFSDRGDRKECARVEICLEDGRAGAWDKKKRVRSMLKRTQLLDLGA